MGSRGRKGSGRRSLVCSGNCQQVESAGPSSRWGGFGEDVTPEQKPEGAWAAGCGGRRRAGGRRVAGGRGVYEQVHLAEDGTRAGGQGSDDDEAAVPTGLGDPGARYLPVFLAVLRLGSCPPRCVPDVRLPSGVHQSSLRSDSDVPSVLNCVEPALKPVLPWEAVI